MTRDAATLPLGAGNPESVHDAGRLNVTSQIVRMLGSLLVVLLLILGAVRLLRRFKLIPEAVQSNGNVPIQQNTVGGFGKNTNPILWMAAQANSRTSDKQPPKFTGSFDGTDLDAANFKLISSINLPGNAASVHLVEAADRLLVIGASQAGGVSLLTQITADGESRPALGKLTLTDVHPLESVSPEPAEYDDDALTAFADILREKAGLPSIAGRSDSRALEQVDARISATQERLNARLKSNAELTVTSANLTPNAPRRRVAAAKGREV